MGYKKTANRTGITFVAFKDSQQNGLFCLCSVRCHHKNWLLQIPAHWWLLFLWFNPLKRGVAIYVYWNMKKFCMLSADCICMCMCIVLYLYHVCVTCDVKNKDPLLALGHRMLEPCSEGTGWDLRFWHLYWRRFRYFGIYRCEVGCVVIGVCTWTGDRRR